MKTNPDKDTELRDKINSETARLPWAELERHFAQGSVIFVSPDLDLIDVAVRISHDDKDSIARWMADGKIGKVTDEQAQAWTEARRLAVDLAWSTRSSWCSRRKEKLN